MDWSTIQNILLYIQHTISCIGIFIIFTGVLYAFWRYLRFTVAGKLLGQDAKVNQIRLDLGRILILGLEFIVAADLIGTTTTPDYYAVGILAIIVLIRTMLSFSLTREMNSLNSP